MNALISRIWIVILFDIYMYVCFSLFQHILIHEFVIIKYVCISGTATVSYTHLDVYKRQLFKVSEFDTFQRLRPWVLFECISVFLGFAFFSEILLYTFTNQYENCGTWGIPPNILTSSLLLSSHHSIYKRIFFLCLSLIHI